MKEITVVAEDKVGLLADISYLLGKAKINIESLTIASLSGKAVIVFLLSDEKRAREILKANGYSILSSEAIVIRLKDEPQQLSGVSALLAKNRINILNMYMAAREKGSTILVLGVDSPRKAKKLLAPYLNLEG